MLAIPAQRLLERYKGGVATQERRVVAASKSNLSGSDTEEKLTSSKDSGLHPDMAFF